MWSSLNELSKAAAQVQAAAAKAVKDTVIGSTLSQAGEQLGSQINTLASSVITLEPNSNDFPHKEKDETSATQLKTLLLTTPQKILRQQPDDTISNGSPNMGMNYTKEDESAEWGQSLEISKDSMAKLSKENAKLRSRLEALEDAASEALGELEDTKEVLKAERAVLSVLKADNSALKAEHAMTVSKCMELEKELSILQRSQLDASTSSKAHSATNNSEESEQVVQQLKDLQEQLEASQETVRAYEARGKRAAKAANEFKAQLAEITPKHEQALEENQRLQKELDALRQIITTSSDILPVITTSSDILPVIDDSVFHGGLSGATCSLQEPSTNEMQAKAPEQGSEAVNHKLEILRFELEEARREVTVLREQNKVETARLQQEHEHEVQGFKDKLVKIEEASSSALKALESELSKEHLVVRQALEAQISDLKDKICASEAEVQQRLSEAQAQEDQILDLQSRISDLQAEVQKRAAEEASALLLQQQQTVTAAEGTAKAVLLQKDVERLKGVLAESTAAHAALQEKLAESESAAVVLRDRLQTVVSCVSGPLTEAVLDAGKAQQRLSAAGMGSWELSAALLQFLVAGPSSVRACHTSNLLSEENGAESQRKEFDMRAIVEACSVLEVEKLRGMVDSLQHELLDARASAAASAVSAAAAAAASNREREAAASSAAAMSQQLQEREEQLQAAQQELQEVQSAAYQAEARLSQVQGELQRAVAELLKESGQVTEMTVEREAAGVERSAHLAELDTLRVFVAEVESQKCQEASALRAQLEEAESLLVELRVQQYEDSQSRERVEKDLEAAEKQISTLQRQLDATQEARHALTLQLEKELRKDMEASEDRGMKLREELKVTRSCLADSESTCTKLREELEEIRSCLYASESACKDLKIDLEVARSRLEASESRCHGQSSEVNELQCKVTTLEGQLKEAEARCSRAESQLEVAKSALAAEKEMASEELVAHSKVAESKLVEAVRAAQAEAQAKVEQEIASGLQLRATLQSDLKESREEAVSLREMMLKLKEESDAASLRGAEVSELRKEAEQLRVEADRCRSAATAATSRQRSLEESLAVLEAEAAERSRKFALVQRTFRSTETELRGQVEVLTDEAGALKRQVDDSRLKVVEAQSSASVALELKKAAELKLESTQAALERMEAQLNAQVQVAAEASARVVAAESALQLALAEQKAASGDDKQLRIDFDRLLAAAIASREEEAEQRVREALENLSAAISRAEAAEKRAEAAEDAKIELTLAMARGDSEDGSSTSLLGGSGSNVYLSRDTRRQGMLGSAASFSGRVHSGGMSNPHLDELLEELQHRAEEAELAAAVQTRRASSAESEAFQLKQQLADAQQSIKDLSWQVKVAVSSGGSVTLLQTASGGTGVGAGSMSNGGALGRAAGMLDFIGCGANYVRK